jgi:hypothetical protein
MTDAGEGSHDASAERRQLSKLLRSKLRRDLIRHLLDDPGGLVSPVELAKSRRVSLADASYHVQQAVALGAVRLAKTEAIRGTTKHYYEPTVTILDNRNLVIEMLGDFDSQDRNGGERD